MKSITLVFILIISCSSIFSQESEQEIYLMTRSYADSIILRWAPSDYSIWNKMKQSDVFVQRRMLGVSDFKKISSNLAVKSLEHIELNFDTDNPHVVAVAEALYGAAENIQPKSGPMGQALDQYNEQNQRFAISAVNADLSIAAANILGWRYTDQEVRKGVPYEYRLLIQPKDGTDSFYAKPTRAKVNAAFKVPQITAVTTRNLEHAVEISWPKAINENYFTGYFIEKSKDDGKTFQRIHQYALIKDAALNDDESFKYVDRLENNYQPLQYRLIGITPFAEQSTPSESALGQGIDLSAPQPPHQVTAVDMKNGKMKIKWKNESKANDHRGFIVGRAASTKGPFRPIHINNLPLSQLEFLDESPIPFQINYYVVFSIDERDNTLRSSVAMGIWNDETPPIQPVALTGKVDSTGHVYLMWEPGKEKDLYGYRVFYSHAKKREFIQLNDEIIRQNYFFDTITTKTLTEHIHYKIVALDNNYNPSEFSEILTLKRPDKVAPNAPVIYEYNAFGETVELRWHNSSSSDVVLQELWLKKAEEQWKKGRDLPKDLTQYSIEGLEKNTAYQFRIIAMDEVGLQGKSKTLSINSGNYSSREGAGTLSLNYDKNKQLLQLSWDKEVPKNAELVLYKSEGTQPIRVYKKIQTESNNWEEKLSTNNKSPIAFALQLKYPDGTVSALSNVVKSNLQ